MCKFSGSMVETVDVLMIAGEFGADLNIFSLIITGVLAAREIGRCTPISATNVTYGRVSSVVYAGDGKNWNFF